MRIALTGGSGIVGAAIIEQALARGDTVVNIDRAAPAEPHPEVETLIVDLMDYDATLAAFRGADVLIHMAAIPSPLHHPQHVVHNNNVVTSYNALHAAITLGITRICQASSVNAIGLSYSRAPRFDYFPVDEKHPNYSEEPYSLSKWICEQQADTFVRRYDNLSIASLRFHWVVPDRATAQAHYNRPMPELAKHLWAYTLRDAAARACLAGVEGRFSGHEVFYIAAPNTTHAIPSTELAATYHPGVPITGDLSGTKAFFDSSKAERLLGWRHDF